jgi:RiboL-PSP-HEPN
MATPLIDFESNFRSAETLLKVYRLLETPDGPQTKHALMERVRELLMASKEEELVLLINELFFGVVRENADVRQTVVKRDSLCLLLRQAIVAACSAIDVYYPALLRTNLPQIITVKQRNFVPNDKNTRDFLKEFSLSMDETLRLITDPKPEQALGEYFFEYVKRRTFSTSQGVAVSLQFLGIDDGWSKIATRLGTNKEPLAKQFDSLVSRRNDIVHRGDRSSKDPTGDIQDISFAWASSNVQTARNVVQASDELVREAMDTLRESAQSSGDGQANS